jgi:hypothetical protein
MTTIESSKKQDRSHLLVEKDQNKQPVTLPPKKVIANKLAAAAAAQAAAAAAAAEAAAQQEVAPTITSPTKRRQSLSIENNIREKKVSKAAAKPTKSITHAERIVQAEINQYRPCKYSFPFMSFFCIYSLKDFTEGDPDSPGQTVSFNDAVVLEYPGPVEPEK